jgi:radical SAM protein with 4Fe4S-binding SPASM domain
MSEAEFDIILNKIQGKASYLYFHLMGEPTLHPQLPDFIQSARSKGFLPVITTNGSLLSQKGDALLSAMPYKVSISLHAPEANEAFSNDKYLEVCVDFAKKAAKQGCFIALRLWNLGSGTDNSKILDFLHSSFPEEWQDIRGGSSQRLSERIFLEWGERFDWPDPSRKENDADADLFCYGLRDQIGILADGTVVPCCLDADANLALGNIFSDELDDILLSPRAKAIYDGFTRRRAVESLCRKCGYARRFSRQ